MANNALILIFNEMKISHFTLCLFAGAFLFSCQTRAPKNQAPIQPTSTYAIDVDDDLDSIVLKAAHVVPTPNQLAALKNEFIAFIHFGPNTFTRMEWGNGMEDPAIFALQQLDTDQWCEAMKAAGMKMVIITAKHHDGFVLWQSRYTKHGVMSSPYQNGKGDILKELSASCQKYGLKLGVYLSPADLYQIENKEGLYGNQSPITKRTIPRAIADRPFADTTKFEFEVDDYNEYFLNQLFELLTEYGPIHEVWFDGAHPKRKGNQQYNYLAWKKLIRKLAPEAVIFGKEDIRWCGNEAGGTRAVEWNVIPYEKDPATMNNFDDLTVDSLGFPAQLEKGNYLHYQPAETNTSIREGWFYRDDTDQKVRSADDVFDTYERSVGGNSIFLLNIPPNRDGRFSDEDAGVLKEVGHRIRSTYDNDLFASATINNKNADSVEITLPLPVMINRFMLQEDIEHHGERVAKHAVDAWVNGAWQEIAQAENIGHKRILRFPEIESNRFRVRILEKRYTPVISRIAAYYYTTKPPQLSFSRNADDLVQIEAGNKQFNWNPNGQNAAANINSGIKIYYTTNGTEPDTTATLYTKPFAFEGGAIKARSYARNEAGAVSSDMVPIAKGSWTSKAGKEAFDHQVRTVWSSAPGAAKQLDIDLAQVQKITALTYTPPRRGKDGLLEKGELFVSLDGTGWTSAGKLEFGNMVNDPSARKFVLPAAQQARFIRIQATQTSGNNALLRVAEIDVIASQ